MGRGKRPRKRVTARRSPSIGEIAGAARLVEFAPVPQDAGQRSGVGLDDGVRRRGAAARDLDAPVGHVEAEALLAEAQLVAGRLRVCGRRGEEGLQRDHDGVHADPGLARGEGRHAAEAPERDHDRLELAPALGELVDPRSRGRGERAAADDARLLEVAQALGEDVGADVWESGAQVGEALGPQQQLADDEQGPALADDVEGACDPAAVAVRALRRRHGAKSTLKLESPCL